MSYIDFINSFWLMDEQKEFALSETRLYFFLLHLANRFFWKMEWFEYGDEKMQATVGISAGALRTARNRLKEANLIDFVAGGKGFRVRTRYQILTPNPNPSPNPNREAFPDPNPEPTQYCNKIKTKNNFNKISKNERFSKREYVASGSDFD
jgi:hypothetical protein